MLWTQHQERGFRNKFFLDLLLRELDCRIVWSVEEFHSLGQSSLSFTYPSICNVRWQELSHWTILICVNLSFSLYIYLREDIRWISWLVLLPCRTNQEAWVYVDLFYFSEFAFRVSYVVTYFFTAEVEMVLWSHKRGTLFSIYM